MNQTEPANQAEVKIDDEYLSLCQYRSLNRDGVPVCKVVSELVDVPLEICHTNDSACAFCLKCDVAPQAPNKVTASMSIHACARAGKKPDKAITDVVTSQIPVATLANIPCILRGPELRQTECKPCQNSSGKVAFVPVYGCKKHGECTLQNTGMLNPRIQGCVTCQDRIPAVVVRNDPTPASVLNAINQRSGKGTVNPTRQ